MDHSQRLFVDWKTGPAICAVLKPATITVRNTAATIRADSLIGFVQPGGLGKTRSDESSMLLLDSGLCTKSRDGCMNFQTVGAQSSPRARVFIEVPGCRPLPRAHLDFVEDDFLCTASTQSPTRVGEPKVPPVQTAAQDAVTCSNAPANPCHSSASLAFVACHPHDA